MLFLSMVKLYEKSQKVKQKVRNNKEKYIISIYIKTTWLYFLIYIIQFSEDIIKNYEKSNPH